MGSASTGTRQTWLALMESAVSETEHVKLGWPIPGTPGIFDTPPSHRVMQNHKLSGDSRATQMGNITARA